MGTVASWCCGVAAPDPTCESLLRYSKATNVPALVEIERDAMRDFHAKFLLGRKLGAGAYATVYECGEVATKKQYACKVYARHGLDAGALECALTEPYLLKRMYHPGILRCRGFYKEPTTYVLVMEELTGGDIFAKLHESKEKLTERDICRLVKLLLEALAYMHARDVVHRDLKLENLMLESTGENAALKIVDFGFAVQLPSKDAVLTEVLGTPGYMAPEVIQGQPYSTPSDVWSAGVIVYTLLCGYPPFHHDEIQDVQKLFRCICYGYFFFDVPYWDDISTEAQDLVRRMLRVTPADRATAAALLDHPWFNVHAALPETKTEPLDVLRALKPLQSFQRIMKSRLSANHARDHAHAMASLVASKLSQVEATTAPIAIDLRRSTLLPTARGGMAPPTP
ncbi:CAMK/CAMK1 protein kinase [Saprolegnia parasitica CBS 223.65]|uniref:CAMK/CAMK1 protein kinase n=1 Tax=Saprolegnia parasitica (strain CBS 223.65) TaxID=695850 RepID=A0A067CNZ4_SAPPC|nr:CAMK/CAMK1 protein kinase [Saprolegnia parasitica CBS 223.65]KDO32188.1 CAMK/CAMK1 protein kinase [Saprolegnia parasitica CBS 223.65]|eukprot:XP_012197369.1 CAMK/CAMK1 protein kinase [Saprolegnia parasitica CBS 223.65]